MIYFSIYGLDSFVFIKHVCNATVYNVQEPAVRLKSAPNTINNQGNSFILHIDIVTKIYINYG